MAEDASVAGNMAFEIFDEFVGNIAGEVPFNFYQSEFLQSIGVPKSIVKRPRQWLGWTVGGIRSGLVLMAESLEVDLTATLANAPQRRQERRAKAAVWFSKQQLELDTAEAVLRVSQVRRLLQVVTPISHFHEKLGRYEATQLRQVMTTMQMLEQFQSRRSATPNSAIQGD